MRPLYISSLLIEREMSHSLFIVLRCPNTFLKMSHMFQLVRFKWFFFQNVRRIASRKFPRDMSVHVRYDDDYFLIVLIRKSFDH